jgi:hypothetical protein
MPFDELIDAMHIGTFVKVWDSENESWLYGTLATKDTKKRIGTIMVPGINEGVVRHKDEIYKSDVAEWIENNSRS